jgi:predicted deacylase
MLSIPKQVENFQKICTLQLHTKNSFINIENFKSKTEISMVKFGDGKLLIVAGVHGNELPAPAAAIKLISYLNSKILHSIIYIIPFVIPYNSTYTLQYLNGQNPNMVADVYGTSTNIVVNLE